ncbi:MAG: cyclase family protein [Candidatus Obscuribacterales bacterium]|nr:cyclase family protein [Candidatus Obscuribacterales bacterium]
MAIGQTAFQYTKIIDISQPVASSSACFPGDTPFSRTVTLTYRDSGIVNLTALTMSPHVGTHADSPIHIKGDMTDPEGMAADLPLDAFVGPVRVIDLAPFTGPISSQQLLDQLAGHTAPPRVLFKTCNQIRYHIFEEDYSYLSVELVEILAKMGVRLTGLDTPSVDHVHSKTLDTHNKLDQFKMVWLENLDLTGVTGGDYFLIALPIKFTELEASPVRAVLLA